MRLRAAQPKAPDTSRRRVRAGAAWQLQDHEDGEKGSQSITKTRNEEKNQNGKRDEIQKVDQLGTDRRNAEQRDSADRRKNKRRIGLGEKRHPFMVEITVTVSLQQ